jgi:hypothetical protein
MTEACGVVRRRSAETFTRRAFKRKPATRAGLIKYVK